MNPFKYKAIKNAFEWKVVKRALIMSGIVGTILVGINHGPRLCAGEFTAMCSCQCMLTFLVPYAVSTVSSVLAMSDMATSDIAMSGIEQNKTD